MSGAIRYLGNGADRDVYAFGRDEAPLIGEVKAQASGGGFATLERWLGEKDALFPPAIEPADGCAPVAGLVPISRGARGEGIPWPQAHVPAASAPDTEISVSVSPVPPTRLSWPIMARFSVSRSMDRAGRLARPSLISPAQSP